MAKLAFVAGDVFQPDVLNGNKAANENLGFAYPGKIDVKGAPLAVVGGAPDLGDHLEELRNWPGEIWAINGAFGWCQDNGIKATFYTLDASPVLVDMAERAGMAIIASNASPLVVQAVDGPVWLVDIEDIPHGCASACTAPMLASMRGYGSVTLFGCGCSFIEREHAYEWSHVTESRLLVKCGPDEYITTPQLIMQAEYMADIVRGLPEYVSVKGGGFLPALAEHGDWDALKVSRNLMDAINVN